jgi:hypothetical protein
VTRPISFTVLRWSIVLLVLLVFASIVAGFDHSGSLHALGQITDQVVSWLRLKTEVLFV